MSSPSTDIPPELLGPYTPRQLFLAMSALMLIDTRIASRVIADLAAKIAENKAAGLHGTPEPRVSSDLVADGEAVGAAFDRLREHGEKYTAAMAEFTNLVMDVHSRYRAEAEALSAWLMIQEGISKG